MIRPEWKWTNDIEDVVLREVNGVDGPVIHVCSGTSGIGDLRIDKWFSTVQRRRIPGLPNVRADYTALPVRSGAAAAVICDPPYSPLRNGKYLPMVVHELVRITKLGGKIIWVCPWILCHQTLRLLRLHMRPMGKYPSYKIISVSEKIQGEFIWKRKQSSSQS